jgi:CheY-like chemotaxis protein
MKEVIIIDDSEVIRLALSSVVSRYFKDLRTYTATDGVEALGYILVTNPDLIIVDLTLPKYSGKEVIEYLSTNPSMLDKKIPVIVLVENKKELNNLPSHFIVLSKEDKDFIEQVVKNSSKALGIEVDVESTFRERLFRKLTDWLINKSNKIDEINEIKDTKSEFKKLLISPYIFLLQLNLSIYISLFFLFYRYQESEENIELQKRDLARFRVRTYSAVGVTLAGIFIVVLQTILLGGGLFSAFIFGNKVVQAASYTWDGGGTDGTCGGNVGDGNKWSCALNWSLDIVPTSADTVTFNGTSTKDAVIDAGFGGVITSINIASGYTGTITQQRSLQTTSTFTQATGTYSASNQTLDIDSTFTLSGGSFTASSGTTSIAGALTISGAPVFNHNNGTMTFDGTTISTLSCNNASFNLVTFAHTNNTKTVSSNCNFPLGNNPNMATGATNAAVAVNGTLSGTGTLTSGTLTINSGGTLSGFTALATLATFTVSGGTVDISGYTSYVASNNVVLSSGSLALPSGSDLNGGLTISGGTFTAPSGNLTLAVALTISGSPTFNANGGTFTFDSSTSATLSCNNVTFNLVVFAHSSNTKTVGSNCNLPLGNNPNITSGGASTAVTLNGTLTGSGTLTTSILTLNSGAVLSGFTALNDTGSFTVAGATINLSAYTGFTVTNTTTVSSGTLILPNGADLNGALTISGGTFTAPSGTMTLSGNLTISGSAIFDANGGTVSFDGATSATLSCNNVAFNFVTISHTANTKIINSNCNLPLGANPTLGSGASSTAVTLNGTLTGTGTLKIGITNFNAGATLVGFNAIEANQPATNPLGTSTHINVTGATLDLSGYISVIANGKASVSSGSLTLPSNTNIRNDLTVSGGTLNVSGTLDLDAGLIISGGTFNFPSGNLNLGGLMTISGSPTINQNATTIFDGGSGTISCNGETLSPVVFSHVSGNKTLNNCNFNVGNNPMLGAGGGIIVNDSTVIGTGILEATGTLLLNNPLSALSGFSGLDVNNFSMSGNSVMNADSYTPFIVQGAFTETSGTFTAPSATMQVNNSFVIAGGTFNHNNGEVILGGGDQQIIGTTFYDLTKVVSSSSTVTFPAGGTETILGTLTLKGASGNVLSLVSSTPGSRWNLDVSNAVGMDLEYLNVTDSNSLSTIIQTAGLNITNGGNNVNWNFGSPEISGVGPSNLIDGSFITESKPIFNFQILDPDSSAQIEYTLIVDNNSDFSSPEIEEDSGLVGQGEFTFTPASALNDDEYYWKLTADDSQGGTSEFLANNGDVAFGVDTVKPTGNVVIAEVDEANPFKAHLIIAAQDNLSGVNEMIISRNSDFANATYEPFSKTKLIEFTKTNGTKVVYVKVKDRAGNESDVFGASIVIVTQHDPEQPLEELPDVEVGEVKRMYSVIVKVVNKKNEVLSDVEVELHSDVKIQTTNENGVAEFENVEEGIHVLIVSYKGERVESEVQVTGDESEEIVIKIVLEGKDLSVWVYITISCSVMVIIMLIILLFLSKRVGKNWIWKNS